MTEEGKKLATLTEADVKTIEYIALKQILIEQGKRDLADWESKVTLWAMGACAVFGFIAGNLTAAVLFKIGLI